jgi:hypothetical protein
MSPVCPAMLKDGSKRAFGERSAKSAIANGHRGFFGRPDCKLGNPALVLKGSVHASAQRRPGRERAWPGLLSKPVPEA